MASADQMRRENAARAANGLPPTWDDDVIAKAGYDGMTQVEQFIVEHLGEGRVVKFEANPDEAKTYVSVNEPQRFPSFGRAILTGIGGSLVEAVQDAIASAEWAKGGRS